MSDTASHETQTAQFEALLQPLLGAAYGTALNLTRNGDDAEDLVQEAALRAFRAFDSFEQGTNFKAWFFRILVNGFLNDYRKKQRTPETVALDDAEDLYLYNHTKEAGLQRGNFDPATVVIDKMGLEQIVAAIAALPEEFRVVATLYFMEQFSYEEIATLLSCPIGTVRSRLHRGRKLLQKSLWQVASDSGVVRALQSERKR